MSPKKPTKKAPPKKAPIKKAPAKKASAKKASAKKAPARKAPVPAPPKKAAPASTEEHVAYGNQWRRVAPGNDAQLRGAESQLEVTFPDDLAALLKECGGGYPEKNYYRSRQHDIEVNVGHILPLVDQPKVSGISAVGLMYRKTHQLPRTLIPFALDTGNANLFCLSLPKGGVVYWLHDEPDDRIREVADSLPDFLNGLTESPF